MRTSVASLASLLSLGLAGPALAITIDNFEAGGFSVVDVAPGPTIGQQAGLAGTDAIGGVRLVRSNATNGGTTTAALVTTAAPDSALISFVDADAPFGSGDVSFVYDGVAAGLTNNGINGALNLDLSSFAAIDVEGAVTSGSVGLQLTLWDATTNQSSAIIPAVNGITQISLGTFPGLDLTLIKTIRVAVLGLDPGDSFSLANISTNVVPEPGTAALFALGLTAFALRRKR